MGKELPPPQEQGKNEWWLYSLKVENVLVLERVVGYSFHLFMLGFFAFWHSGLNSPNTVNHGQAVQYWFQPRHHCSLVGIYSCLRGGGTS